jgi:hypothetical protein
MPPGGTQYTNESGVITLSSCDPGPGEALSTGTAADAFAFVTLRADAFELGLVQNKPVDEAWCVAENVAAGATLTEAQDPGVLRTPEFAPKLSQAELDCR